MARRETFDLRGGFVPSFVRSYRQNQWCALPDWWGSTGAI